MARGLEAIAPPAEPVYRISRPPDLFAPPPWEVADPDDGTFGGRFDDPGQLSGILAKNRFRIIYCASQRKGAFAETIVQFRPPVSAKTSYQQITEDPDFEVVHRPVVDPDYPDRGIVPLDWRLRRFIGSAVLDRSLRFVDLMSPRTMHHLRSALAEHVAAFGLHDVDLSTLTGNLRLFTQLCSRYIYDERPGPDNHPLAGIRYLSRLNPDWECWAMFDTRAVYDLRSTSVIGEDDVDLLDVAAVFNLSIERLQAGTYLRP
jgi:hypothetical protein